MIKLTIQKNNKNFYKNKAVTLRTVRTTTRSAATESTTNITTLRGKSINEYSLVGNELTFLLNLYMTNQKQPTCIRT